MARNDFSINDAPTMKPAPISGGGRLAAGDTILGRYTVVHELGEGGMGVVYQCLDTVGGVEVAVKGLPPEVSRNEDEMDDIRANYQIVRKLRHPNIAGVATLEVDGSTGDYYLVMDLARGTSLKRWARRHPDADRDAKLAILRQVAAALDYAHAEKVIHRDVKPENVMVDDDGRVKVLDFGLAAQIRSSQSRTSNTVTSKGGTPGYKSPEQWLGRPQQAPADVYAFGVMAYWLFSGRLPFECDDPAVLGHAVLSAPVEPIPDLPAHMNAALAKALAKQPEERFTSCGEVVDALEGKGDFSRVEHVERVEGENGRARSPSGPQPGGSRSRATALLIVAALVLAIVGGWWYYRQEQLREQQRRAAESARQKTAAEEAKRKAEEEARERQAQAMKHTLQNGIDAYKVRKDKWPGKLENWAKQQNRDTLGYLSNSDYDNVMHELLKASSGKSAKSRVMDPWGLMVLASADADGKFNGMDYRSVTTKNNKYAKRMEPSEITVVYPGMDDGKAYRYVIEYNTENDDVTVMTQDEYNSKYSPNWSGGETWH